MHHVIKNNSNKKGLVVSKCMFMDVAVKFVRPRHSHLSDLNISSTQKMVGFLLPTA